jgi:hypothetical protein
MRTTLIGSAALAVVVSISALVIACGGGGEDRPDPTRVPTAAGVSTIAAQPSTTSGGSGLSDGVQLNPDNGGVHLAAGLPGSGYTETPATSGLHWFAPSTAFGVPAPARWGEYDLLLPDEILIHNLEHGGIGIHYDCPQGCPELIDQLRDLIPRNPSQFIMSPYPGMDSQIAITAWRRHLHLDGFDESIIREFIELFLDRAPESVPGNTF